MAMLSGSFAQEVNQTKPPDPRAVPAEATGATPEETQGVALTEDEAKKTGEQKDNKTHRKDDLRRGVMERGASSRHRSRFQALRSDPVLRHFSGTSFRSIKAIRLRRLRSSAGSA
jgi:hypothetical protein